MTDEPRYIIPDDALEPISDRRARELNEQIAAAEAEGYLGVGETERRLEAMQLEIDQTRRSRF